MPTRNPNFNYNHLETLRCFSCNNYLSYLPIHSSSDSCCGRCKWASSEDTWPRNRIFEAAIEHQKFPCINNVRGCLETLYPSEVPEHELQCIYQEAECYLYNCKWIGDCIKLTNHIIECHPNNILRNSFFKVVLERYKEDNYIIFKDNYTYLVKTVTDNEQTIFSIRVLPIGTIPPEKHVYRVKVINGANKKEYTCVKNMDETFEIFYHDLKTFLENPAIILAHIDIEDNNTESIRKKSMEKWQPYKCRGCEKYLIAPIFQCEIGHSVCGICKLNLGACPDDCNKSFPEIRNYDLERIVETLIYPCSYAGFGCKYTATEKEIRDHETCCLFAPFQCPLKDEQDCCVEFKFKDLNNHINKFHVEDILPFNTVNMPFDSNIEENIEDYYIIFGCSRLFKLYFLYDATSKMFKWTVHLIGVPENSKIYKYSIDIIDKNGIFKTYLEDYCITKAMPPFEERDNFVTLSFDQVIKFIKCELTYRVFISVL